MGDNITYSDKLIEKGKQLLKVEQSPKEKREALDLIKRGMELKAKLSKD